MYDRHNSNMIFLHETVYFLSSWKKIYMYIYLESPTYVNTYKILKTIYLSKMPFSLDYFVIFKYQSVYLMIFFPFIFNTQLWKHSFLFFCPRFPPHHPLELFLKNNLACSFLKQKQFYNFTFNLKKSSNIYTYIIHSKVS